MPIAITIPGAAYPIFAEFKIKDSGPLNNLFENAKNKALPTIIKAPVIPNFNVFKTIIHNIFNSCLLIF